MATSGCGLPATVVRSATALQSDGTLGLLSSWTRARTPSAPLSLAYPLFSLAFIVTPVAAYFILGEPLTWRIFAGGVVILIGVLITVW